MERMLITNTCMLDAILTIFCIFERHNDAPFTIALSNY